MTLWLDAHLDPELAAWLGARFGVIAKTTREVGLNKAEDQELFDAAKRIGDIVIMSKDQDLVDLVHRLGPPPSIVWLRCGNMRTIRLQVLLARTFGDALALLNAGHATVQITEAGVEPA